MDIEGLNLLFERTGWGDMASVASTIYDWAEMNFPDRVPEASLSKLAMEEIPELLIARKKGATGKELAGEWADCMILLLDLAVIWGISPGLAIRQKMKINARRSWVKDETTGFYNHLEEENESAVEGSGPAVTGVRREAVDDSTSEPSTDCRGAPLSGLAPGSVFVRYVDGWHTSQLIRTSGGWKLGTCSRCGRDLDGGFALPDQIHFGKHLAGHTEETEGTGIG